MQKIKLLVSFCASFFNDQIRGLGESQNIDWQRKNVFKIFKYILKVKKFVVFYFMYVKKIYNFVNNYQRMIVACGLATNDVVILCMCESVCVVTERNRFTQ